MNRYTDPISGPLVGQSARAPSGSATLVAGTVTINTSKVTAVSRIFPAHQSPGGTLGALYVSARTPGTSFVITSLSGSDTSVVAWHIVEP